MNKVKPVLAWHFLPDDGCLRWGTKEKVRAGRVYRVDGPLQMCKNGLHASKKIIAAVRYAPGSIICRVELRKEILTDTDKLCARERKVLWMIDATNILHEFACRCAEDALALLEKPDPRSIAVIKAKRDWVAGKITDDELAAARDAARDAAMVTAWDAAWGAARAARAAAWDAQNKRLTAMVTAARRQN